MKFRIILAIFLFSTFFVHPLYGSDSFSKQSKGHSGGFFSLKLLGTIVEPDTGKSIAVIKNMRSDEQGVFKIADKILDYEIVKIMRGKTFLLKKGKVYVLEFSLGTEFIEPIIVVSSDKRIINRNALSERIPDVNLALGQAIVIPYIESGKIIGLRVTKIKDKTLAKMAGIKEGDVVTAIDGEKPSSIKNIINIYSRAKNKEKISLEIKRGDEIKDLIYYMN